MDLEAVRTFAAVFPDVTLVKGSGGYGLYMLGSSAPVELREANIRAVLARPGVLEDISSAYDSPANTVDAWIEIIARQTWLTGDASISLLPKANATWPVSAVAN